MKTAKLLRALAKNFPKKIGKKYHDPIGLQTGKLKEETNNILLCLDFDEAVFEIKKNELTNKKYDLIITHHPFIFGTKRNVFKHDINKEILCSKIDELNIPIYSFHTNFDEGKDGMNDALANKLGLLNIKPLEGDPMARGGNLKKPMNIYECANFIKKALNVSYGLLLPYGKNEISNIAVVGGGGWKTFRIAQDENYDLFISGDIPHHGRREVISYKYNYLDLPHEIENIFIDQMFNILKAIDSNLNIDKVIHEKEPIVI